MLAWFKRFFNKRQDKKQTTRPHKRTQPTSSNDHGRHYGHQHAQTPSDYQHSNLFAGPSGNDNRSPDPANRQCVGHYGGGSTPWSGGEMACADAGPSFAMIRGSGDAGCGGGAAGGSDGTSYGGGDSCGGCGD